MHPPINCTKGMNRENILQNNDYKYKLKAKDIAKMCQKRQKPFDVLLFGVLQKDIVENKILSGHGKRLMLPASSIHW